MLASILSDNVQRIASLLRTPFKSSFLVGGLTLSFKTMLHSFDIIDIAGSNILLVTYTLYFFKFISFTKYLLLYWVNWKVSVNVMSLASSRRWLEEAKLYPRTYRYSLWIPVNAY